MEILKVNEDDFEEQVLQADTPTLVDFYADWCGPCRGLAPILEGLAQEDQIRIAKVDVDKNPKLTDQYKIMSVPTLLLFKDGEVADRKTGGISKQEIQGMVL